MSEEITEDYPDDFPYPGCLVYYCGLLSRYEKGLCKIKFFQNIPTVFYFRALYYRRYACKEVMAMCSYCKSDKLVKEECERCGKKYFSADVAGQLEKLVNAAKQLMREISAIDYSKAA